MRALIFIISLFLASTLSAQTGPAGVGTPAVNPLWLKADFGTSTTVDGNNMSQWRDASGNGNHAAQPTATLQPFYTTPVMNNMPAVFFDNSNDLMVIPDANNLDNTSGLTILTVTRPTALNGAARAIVSKRNNANDNESYCLFYYTSDKLFIDIDDNNNRFNTNIAFVAPRNYVSTVLFDGSLATGSRVKTYINETLDITAGESSSSIPNGNAPVLIGSMNLGDGRPFGGYISEVIIFTKALTAPERIIAHNYLFAKYGFSNLSNPATVNDLYAGDDAANGDYDFEMVGIGTDGVGPNLSASSAIAGGMGMTSVSGLDPGDYVMWAHASGNNAVTLSDVGGMTGSHNARWSRIWYVDITNTSTVETVDVVFDMSDAGSNATPANATNYVLLMRAGQSGNWTEVTTANSIAGDRIIFNNISLSADGYYTVGTRDYTASPLPVSLLDFTGEYTSKGVELKWTTATEVDNDHFTIQRSPNGDNFKTIAKVLATGTSFRETTYTAIDTEPYNDKAFYRLLQTDYDGRTTTLKTIAVSSPGANHEIEIIPNPSNGIFSFNLPVDISNGGIKLFNTAGQLVPFTYNASDSQVTVDATTLPSGIYFLKLSSDRGTYSAKVVIMP